MTILDSAIINLIIGTVNRSVGEIVKKSKFDI